MNDENILTGEEKFNCPQDCIDCPDYDDDYRELSGLLEDD